MRVMVIVKATADSEAGHMPSTKMFEEMGRFNEELVKAGIMLAGDGLKPSANGKRVRFSGANRTVIDGPFAETRELVAGYWLWQVRSLEEAVEWVRRCPNPCPVIPISKSVRCTKRRISARSSPRSCASRKTACAPSCRMPATELQRTIDAVWRIESARIVAAVARIVRDVGLAEELAQDALVSALEHWPTEGLPRNPAAWLMATAKNKALDRIRQAALHRRKQEELGADVDARGRTRDAESAGCDRAGRRHRG